MKLTIGEHAGFCFGVRRAVDKAFECAKEQLPCVTLGPLIHNPQEVARLTQAGVCSVSSLDEVLPGQTVIIRSHGVMPGVYDQCRERGIPVICYGLRTDFRGELFEGSRELLCWADTIEEIKTICWCGRKATFNARVHDGKIVRHGEQIMLGGNSTYISLCRRHWKSGELGGFKNLNEEE